MRPSFSACSDELRKIANILDEKARLQPGDILLMSGGSKDAFKGKTAPEARKAGQDIVTTAIRPFTGPYGHAALYAGKGQVIDAHPAYGVGRVDLSSFDDQKRIKVLRPALPRAERREAVEMAEGLIGSKYSTPSTVKAYLAGKSKGNIEPKDIGIICSNMIANLYGGKVTPGKNPNYVMPADFNESPTLKTVLTVENP